jgi:tetratricopeptide (TPR) repeat protein
MTRLTLLFLLMILSAMVIAQDGKGLKKPMVEDYLKLYEQNKQAGDIKEATRFLNEAATLVWEDKDYHKAVEYFNQSIELNKQINNESGISKIQSNLGMIFADMKQYETSLDHFTQSQIYRETVGSKPEIISGRINISVVLNNLKKYNEAAQNLEVALEHATEMNDAQQMKACYGMLAETYEKAGNQERTTHYFNLYRTFTEMISRTTVKAAKQETEQAQLLALQADLEKKQKEIELLKTSSELKETEKELSAVSAEAQSLIDNNTKQALAISLMEREGELNALRIVQVEQRNALQNKITILISMVVVAFIIFFLVMYRSYRYKKIVNIRLAEQNEEIKTLNESLSAKLPTH